MMSNILNLILIPLIAGVFKQTTGIRVIEAEVGHAVLSSLADQNTTFSPGFSFSAYNHEWLNGTLPPFVSQDRGYAILPFKVTGNGKYSSNETWIGETVLYEADLSCDEAIVAITDTWFNISNGHDCAHNIYADIVSPVYNPFGRFKSPTDGLYRYKFIDSWTTWFMGGYPSETYSLSSGFGNCSNKNSFLGIWVHDKPVPQNMTAIFCEPSYWSQAVLATVQMPGGVILHVERTGIRTPFREFNIPRFEQLISTGRIAPLAGDLDPVGGKASFGYGPTWFPDPTYQLVQKYRHPTASSRSYVGRLDVNSISSFVFARERNDSLAELLEPGRLADAYSDAFKMLFSFAVGPEMTDNVRHSRKIVARKFETQMFVVDRWWARLSLAGFVVMIVFGVCLMVISRNRPCVIDGEPNSIAASLMMISHNRALAHDLNNAEYQDPRGLRKQLIRVGNRYQLRDFGRGPQIHVIGGGGGGSVGNSRLLLNPILVESDDKTLVPYHRPVSWLMSLPAGGLFILAFTGLLALMIVLYVSHNRYHGLFPTIPEHMSRNSPNENFTDSGLSTVAPPNSFWYTLLFSYTPTVVGMSIEPLWIELGTYACMIMPYETLRKGNARSSQSLTIDYDGMPPLMQLLPALKARNPILVTLVLAILLTNLLAVALAGMFSPITGLEVVPTETSLLEIAQRRYGADFKPGDELFYLLLLNASGFAQLPPWVTSDFLVLPFHNRASNTANTGFQRREGASLGLGAEISCQFMAEDMFGIQPSDIPERQGYVMTMSHPCDFGRYFLPTAQTPSSDFVLISKHCPDMFVAGWIEQLPNPHPTSSSDSDLNETDHIVLLCKWNYRTAEMLVTVDTREQVLELHNIDSKSWSSSALVDVKRDSTSSNDTLLPIFTTHGPMSGFLSALSQYSDPKYPYNTSNSPEPNRTYQSPQAMSVTNYLMRLFEPSIRPNPTNHSFLPNRTLAIKTFERVFTSLFALHLHTGYDRLFEHTGVRRHTMGTTTIATSRVAISTPMFAITTGILAFFILALGVFYGKRPGHHLSYLPTTLAGVFALLYASNALEDVRAIRGGNVAQRAAELEKLDGRYGCGSFVGSGRRKHFGVFKEPAVDETEIVGPENELIGRVWEVYHGA